MDTKRKKNALIITAVIAGVSLLCNIILVFVVLPRTSSVFSGTKTASLSITVKDAATEEPLENSTVCIIETGGYYKTDKDGKTGVIKVPLLKNTNFDKSSPRPWGEITLLAYKDGYIDFILFYVMVYENQTRNGPNIYLYATDDPETALTHSLVEGPETGWVNDLVRKYKK